MLQTRSVSSKLHNIVREILENEENYVRSLKAGIDNYMSAFDRKEIPKSLRGQKHRIFANIKTIYHFHQHEFLPALVLCDEDPEQIAEVFTNFVTRDFFYGYIIYAINRKRSEKLCNSDISGAFWKVCSIEAKILTFWLVRDLSRCQALRFYFTECTKRVRRPTRDKFLPSPADSKATSLPAAYQRNHQRLIEGPGEHETSDCGLLHRRKKYATTDHSR